MKIAQCRIHRLRIPFVQTFRHSASTRDASDAFVVAVADGEGVVGYGEGVARPYVTGETAETAYRYLMERFWPAVAGVEFPPLSATSSPFDALDRLLPDDRDGGVVAWNSARAAFELALIDLSLKREKLSISDLMPPLTDMVTYDGVISASDPASAAKVAKRFAGFGITRLKIKTGNLQDEERIAAVRQAVPEARLRVDFNGACDPALAIAKLAMLLPYGIECAEQPIPRGDVDAMAKVRAASSIPIMADESLVTVDDARELIKANACDFFNLRLSKLGGLGRTLRIAEMAKRAGIRLQIGCQVGETAILSAAGRALAAHLAGVEYLEGSYGRMLLVNDVAKTDVAFGAGGKAPCLAGPGWGIDVDASTLETYAEKSVTLP